MGLVVSLHVTPRRASSARLRVGVDLDGRGAGREREGAANGPTLCRVGAAFEPRVRHLHKRVAGRAGDEDAVGAGYGEAAGKAVRGGPGDGVHHGGGGGRVTYVGMGGAGGGG